INEYISKIDLDLLFIEKLDINYINELIEKIEKFYEENYIEPVENDIRKKVVEKFKKIIKFLKLLYINYSDLPLNYNSLYFNCKTERAPPFEISLA
ncbi:hypothetical protein PKF05_11620, partial [Fusobacterium simiae]|nr:hypothetical protein [Fusobacterium simiae]